jgi:hypothetical protein
MSVVAVATAAHRGFYPGLGEAFGVTDGDACDGLADGMSGIILVIAATSRMNR